MTDTMKAAVRGTLVTVSVGILVWFDLFTKSLAEAYLMGKSAVRVVGDLAVLVWRENPGAFLGLGSEFNPVLWFVLFIGLPVVFIVLLYVLLLMGKAEGRVMTIAYVMFIAGGAGNLWDRILRDRLVRDFMNFGIGDLRTGVLNVADLYVTAAAVILLIKFVLDDRKAKKQS